MKRSKSTIKRKDRVLWALDPFYSQCALKSHLNHICGGTITWEHTLIVAGKSYQEKWAVIPLCEKAHAVNNWQDAGTMKKEVNVWIALNRATDMELKAISKVENYIRKREYLNSKYGVYVPKVESLSTSNGNNYWY